MAGTFLQPNRQEDPRRCRVCGNLSLTPTRRVANWLFIAIIGALLMYIVLDVAENGRLDASIAKHVVKEWRARSSPPR